MPEIAALLRQQMTRLGWTQRRLAQELGVSEAIVSRWLRPEAKVQPTVANCHAIARVLDIPASLVLRMAGYVLAGDAEVTGTSECADAEFSRLQLGLQQALRGVPTERQYAILAAITQLVAAFRGPNSEDA